MTTTNKHRRVISETQLDDYLNDTEGVKIQISDNYWVAIKDYKPQRANVVLNNMRHKAQAIDTRKRLLEKLNAKYDIKRISAIDREYPQIEQGGISE